jgi:hypothetical protein
MIRWSPPVATSPFGSPAAREKIIKFFSRHLVGLTIRFKCRKDANAPARFKAFSGTLIILQDVVCFLTAGHILSAIEEARSSEDIEIEAASLVDTLGTNPVSDVPIPFDLTSAHLIYVDDDTAGLDFGVIPLRPHYVDLLAKNGVVALAEENWLKQHTVTCDVYWMLGFPEELTSEKVSPRGVTSVQPIMFGVEKLDAAPDDRSPTEYPQFVGRLHPALALNSIKGMSGGPIFGFKLMPNGQLAYWIVALQSSWKRETRTVYGCSLPALASLLTASPK